MDEEKDSYYDIAYVVIWCHINEPEPEDFYIDSQFLCWVVLHWVETASLTMFVFILFVL